VKAPRAPRLDERRAAEFSAELRSRARAWMPSWSIADDERDFGAALLDIAARFSSEVAERLDKSGEKMRRGFLDWLAVRGEAARPARMPVSFKLADAARVSVLAEAPVRMQVDAAGLPVVFETEQDVLVIPGRLQVVVVVDAGADAIYMAPPGFSDLQPLEPLPVQWELKSFAAAGSRKLQLDPESGLTAEMIIAVDGGEYRIVEADKGIVTIEPGLDSDISTSTTLRKVTTFTPFDSSARNRQEHVLYLGDLDLLNVDAAATIDVVGATALVSGAKWEYWGKRGDKEEVGWQELRLAEKQDQSGAVRLNKPKGAIQPRDIEGKNSRWIRAYAIKTTGTEPMLQVDALELRVNCQKKAAPCPPNATSPASPAAEAMANTTPIVLDSVFYPLGKEPKQFDAFYLGSQEAFSKKKAEVQLCFEMADPTFAALSAVREGAYANAVLAGVGADGALHLFAFDATNVSIGKLREREPLQPGAALDRQPKWRLPTWSDATGGFFVAVAAREAIWVWHEHADASKSAWISAGPVSNTQSSPRITGLLYLGDANPPQLVALRENAMWFRKWPNGQVWTPFELKNSADVDMKLMSIVPVLVANAANELVTSKAKDIVGISKDGELFHVTASGIVRKLPVGVALSTDVVPVAMIFGGDLVVIAVEVGGGGAQKAIVAYRDNIGIIELPLDAGMSVVATLDAALIKADLHIFAAVKDGAAGRLLTWMPYGMGNPAARFDSAVTSSGGNVGGAPILLGNHVVVAGDRADILVSDFDLSRRYFEKGTVEMGVIVPASINLFVNDLIVEHSASHTPEYRVIMEKELPLAGEKFFKIDSPFLAAPKLLDAYPVGSPLSGTLLAPDTLELDPTDRETLLHSRLYIDGEFFTVDALDKTAVHWKATISPVAVGGMPPSTAKYVQPITTGGRVAWFIPMKQPLNGNWDAGLLATHPLIFPALASPHTRSGKAFSVNVLNQPGVVVLDSALPLGAHNFVLDGAVGKWSRLLGDPSVNPELSWEYWNGRGWWKLPVTFDQTLQLKSKGALQFTIPSDIAASDWAGKTNYWIRARLVGGDYGREEVSFESVVVNGVTKQTVVRSSEGIHAPTVVKLSITYRVRTNVLPTFVLAQDSGSMRDQSDANRTGGAQVEAFTPIAVALGRLSGAVVPAVVKAESPPDCECQDTQAETSATPSDAETATAAPFSGRALLVGLDAAPSSGPVNVFLRVDAEHNHDAFAPLVIEALVAEQFVPIVARDATRGLGQSGVVSMSFALEPTRRELFGKELTWLRLTPASGPDSKDWKPSLCGAYLNTVWASATETLTRELLGSSEGAPDLALKLARPPVLHDTLELRVREPLGEEERTALRHNGAAQVLSEVDGLPGDWVLWRRVTDPLDEAPTARVYAIDETNGIIRFGDGLHGMIPPTGVDSIVAFSYKRTEPPKPGSDSVPGNLVTERTPLNLVSPVASVEAVISVDQSAGGAPPEDDDRVLRFGFARVRHRNRAVTLRDIEDLALQSSPDIVQARCMSRKGYLRLVVVMRGKDPLPHTAQIRELRRLLLDSAPAALSAPNALRISGPAIRRLRVELTLRVDTLDHAGTLSDAVKQRITALFDAATGGQTQDGWQLGANPQEEDIALALLDVPHLESIGRITLQESTPAGDARAWPTALASHELVVLDKDPIRIQLAPAEVMA
jgi:hypothetical protein